MEGEEAAYTQQSRQVIMDYEIAILVPLIERTIDRLNALVRSLFCLCRDVVVQSRGRGRRASLG